MHTPGTCLLVACTNPPPLPTAPTYPHPHQSEHRWTLGTATRARGEPGERTTMGEAVGRRRAAKGAQGRPLALWLSGGLIV